MHRTRIIVGLSVIAVLAAAGLVVSSIPSSGPTKQQRQATDGAVIDALLPLNDNGIALARVAARKATRAKLRSSALAIAQELKLENDLMRSIHKRLFGQPAYAAGGGSMIHGAITYTAASPGMAPATLRSAKPFDREFLDTMIAGQLRAAALAQTQVAHGENGDLKNLSADIARRADIHATRLNAWRKRWYGRPSPAVRGGHTGTSMPGMSMG